MERVARIRRRLRHISRWASICIPPSPAPSGMSPARFPGAREPDVILYCATHRLQFLETNLRPARPTCDTFMRMDESGACPEFWGGRARQKGKYEEVMVEARRDAVRGNV